MDKSKVDVSSADFKEPFLTQKARATEIKINPPLISSTSSLRLLLSSNNRTTCLDTKLHLMITQTQKDSVI